MTGNMKTGIVFLALWGMYQTAGAETYDWTEQISALKSTVVNIEISKQIAFEDELRGTFYATGFIVDGERGIIATNAHVIETSPSSVKISFANGSFTEAKPLYYDPIHDFGFFKINPKQVSFPLRAVRLDSGRSVKVGEEVLLIGNNEREQYSIKYGTVANKNVNKGRRYSSYLHTTFDRTSGSSGSPVWNKRGEVVGLHGSGTSVSSFELIIDYVRDALIKIQNNIPIRRGDIGVDLRLIAIGEAVQNFHFPEGLWAELKLPSGDITRVMQIESVIPQSTVKNILQTGDIIYRIDGTLARDDLYGFDRVLDDHVGGKIKLDIYRRGTLLQVNLPVVDMELKKISRYVRFAGAVFHDLTPYQRRNLDFAGGGIYMPYADRGSSFASLGERGESGKYRVVISELDGNPIENLDDFISVCRKLSDNRYTYAVLRDFSFVNRTKRAIGLKIILRYNQLEIYQFNKKTLEWEKVSVQ